MKRTKTLFALMVFVLGAVASTSALAWHHGGARFGVYFGPGLWYPPYSSYYPPYYPPYYYPPVAPAAPTAYIEQGSAQPAPAQSAPAQPQGQWYYCNSSKAYYPYVKECPGGWQRVAPQPAS